MCLDYGRTVQFTETKGEPPQNPNPGQQAATMSDTVSDVVDPKADTMFTQSQMAGRGHTHNTGYGQNSKQWYKQKSKTGAGRESGKGTKKTNTVRNNG